MGVQSLRSVRLIGTVVACVAVTSIAAGAMSARRGATGEEVYAAQKCASCHSVGGQGSKKYPLDHVGSRLSEPEIREWLVNPDAQQAKKGTRPLMRMPSYRSLPPDDLDALVTYIGTLK